VRIMATWFSPIEWLNPPARPVLGCKVVKMKQRRGAPMGMHLFFINEHCGALHIRSLDLEGTIPHWNSQQPEEGRVCAGDTIISINSIHNNPKRMLQEIRTATTLSITIFPTRAMVTASEKLHQRDVLSRSVVEALPRVPAGDCEATECSICLDEFDTSSLVVQLPCQHVFHPDCVSTWLTEHVRTCPLCKRRAHCTHGCPADARARNVNATQPLRGMLETSFSVAGAS